MKIIIPILVGLLVLVVPPVAQAVVPITVDIGGTIFSGDDTVNIPNGTYGGITISGIAVGTTARVVSQSDNTMDRLEFRNAKIKGTATGTEYHISFEGTFNDPPNGQWYYRIRGRLDRFEDRPGAAVNSWVKAVGWFSQPIGTWYQLGTGPLTPPNGMTITALNYTNVFYPTHTQATQFSNVSTAQRKLKGELFFRVTNTNDTLKISDNADALTVHSSAMPGPGDPDPCKAEGTACGDPVVLPNCRSFSGVPALQSFLCRWFGKCTDYCWSFEAVPREPIKSKTPPIK